MNILKNKVFTKMMEYFFIVVGAILAAWALECFLIPNSILDGGVNGVSMIFNRIYGWNLSILIVVINIPFLFIGYKNLGLEFLIKSFISILVFSLFIHLFSDVKTITDDIVLATIYGSAALGTGVGLIIKFGGCLDGTESLGLVVSKNTSLSVGQFVLICNCIIFLDAAFVFGVDRALISLLAYFITSKIIDMITNGFESAKAAMIITDDGEEISKIIYNKIGRTCTKIKGKGLLSGDKEILYCVITRLEVIELRKIVLASDNSAFITITDVSEIIGSHIKDNNSKIKK